jgi:hypothetical protein
LSSSSSLDSSSLASHCILRRFSCSSFLLVLSVLFRFRSSFLYFTFPAWAQFLSIRTASSGSGGLKSQITQWLPYEPSSTRLGDGKEVQKNSREGAEGAHHLDEAVVGMHR